MLLVGGHLIEKEMKDIFLLKTTGVTTTTADNDDWQLQSQVDGLAVVVKETGT